MRRWNNAKVSQSRNNKTLRALSELEIDADKDWAAKKIENLGAPDSGDDAPRDDTIDSKINTHKGDASAHHTKTTDAGDITSGIFAEPRIPAYMSKSKLAWTADKLLKGAGPGADPTEVAIGTGAGEIAAGDHTHTLTITHLAGAFVRSAENGVWTDITSYTIAANRKKVILLGATQYGDVRGLYNGVEKFSVYDSVVGSVGYWIGDGLTSSALAQIQFNSDALMEYSGHILDSDF